MHASTAVPPLACVDCHGGRADTTDKLAAHVKARYPSQWPTTGNPVRSYTLLNRESIDYVRFRNPGDLRVVDQTCGRSLECHSNVAAKVKTSFMSHGAFLWGAALYNNGAFPSKRPTFGESYSKDGIAQNLTATMEWTLFGLGNSSAMLTGFLTVKNDTPANVTLALFHYLDLDLGGTKGDDSSNAIQNSEILVGDANWVADYKAIATGFTAFDSNAFPSVRDLLTNNAKDDFPNTEKFFGPGDWTGGFEWMRTVNANGGTAGVTFNLQIGPRPAPGPTSLGLLLVGLVGLLLARRRTGSLGQR